MSMEIGILAGFFLVVMAGAVLAGHWFLGRVSAMASRPGENSVMGEPDLPATQAVLAQAFRSVGEAVPASKAAKNPVRSLLIAAGYRYPSAVPIYYGIKCATALLLATILGWASFHNDVSFPAVFIAMVCGCGFGLLLPDRVLEWMVRSRAGRIHSAIPAALDLLTLSVEAGQSLNQAIVDTSLELRDAYPDLSGELAQVNLELRAGKSRAEAIQHLAARNKDPELKKLVGLLLDSERFGTSLGPALRTHAKYLRTRMRQQAQEAARKVGVKLVFPVFFLIFPSVLLVTLGPAVIQMMNQLKIMMAE